MITEKELKAREAYRKWYKKHTESAKEKSKTYYQKNKEKCRETRRKWKNKNKEKDNEYSRQYHRLKSGCINPTGETKTGLCKICSKETKLYYDHEHSTGKFRGWICRNCNVVLGLVNDSTYILNKMIDYIK